MKNKILLTAVSSFYILHSAFGQGALTPPGAPAPTMKSLDQIEPRTPISSLPFTITQPGSYYLTTNLTGNPGGITISAGDVTLDLMGFALVGGTGDGVFVSGSRTNIAIRNGAVRGWSIGVNATNSFNSSVSDLQLSRNTINGGLRGGSGALVRNCVAFLNATGIQVGDGSSVVNCVARNNGDIGIRAGVGCTVSGCVGRDNLGNINVGNDCRVSDCASSYSGVGLVSSGITVEENCTISGCTSKGASWGITTGGNCTISGCMAVANISKGIITGARCSIVRCTANDNGEEGIYVTDWCQVIENLCNRNGSSSTAAGIRTTGFANRVDGNTCIANDRGIEVSGSGSLIIRNCLRGNSIVNLSIAAGNTTGPVVDSSNIATSSNPHANYFY